MSSLRSNTQKKTQHKTTIQAKPGFQAKIQANPDFKNRRAVSASDCTTNPLLEIFKPKAMACVAEFCFLDSAISGQLTIDENFKN